MSDDLTERLRFIDYAYAVQDASDQHQPVLVDVLVRAWHREYPDPLHRIVEER